MKAMKMIRIMQRNSQESLVSSEVASRVKNETRRTPIKGREWLSLFPFPFAVRSADGHDRFFLSSRVPSRADKTASYADY